MLQLSFFYNGFTFSLGYNYFLRGASILGIGGFFTINSYGKIFGGGNVANLLKTKQFYKFYHLFG